MRSKIREVCWILLVVCCALYIVVAVNFGKYTIIAITPAIIASLCALHLFFDWLYGDYIFYCFGHVIIKTDTDMQTEIDEMMTRELEEVKRRMEG